jgi:hypothetical protein
LTLRDDGAGGCTFASSTNSSGDPVGPFQPCRNVFPGPVCASYPGALTLTFVYNGSSAFRDPEFQTILDVVGLGSVTTVWRLSLHIIHVTSIPRDIRPAFLPKLALINNLAIFECISEITATGKCTGSDTPTITPSPPAPRRLVALPDLVKVDRIPGDLFVQNTGFTNMTSFRGVRCLPPTVQLLGLDNLVSLQGFEGVGPWTRTSGGPIVVISPSPRNVSALRTMALYNSQGQTPLSGAFVSFQSAYPCSTPGPLTVSTITT